MVWQGSHGSDIEARLSNSNSLMVNYRPQKFLGLLAPTQYARVSRPSPAFRVRVWLRETSSDSKTEPALISSLVLWPHPLINEHVIVSTIGCHTPAQRPSSLSCKKPALCKVRVVFSKPVHAVRSWGDHGLFKAKPSSHHVHSTLRSLSCKKPALCKVRVVFSKPVHAVRAWGDPPGTNHGLFKAKPSSHHVHSTLSVTPPTSPCPTLSADAEIIFSAQCAVWCNQKCTIGFNGLKHPVQQIWTKKGGGGGLIFEDYRNASGR